MSRWALSADPGINGTCLFEVDGSVGELQTQEVGSLQGAPVGISLSLGGRPRSGEKVLLLITAQIVPPSPAAIGPVVLASWQGTAAILANTSGRGLQWGNPVILAAIGDGERSGRATFSDLPRDGTSDPDWPKTLSGQISWECR